MIDYGGHFAHAHDWEQVLFMSLAPACLDSLPEFRDTRWLHQWKDFWIEHKATYANGCSNIDLSKYLEDAEKVSEFRRFLSRYLDWIGTFGTLIPVDEINAYIDLDEGMYMTQPCATQELRSFVGKVVALLDGDTTHSSVHPIPNRPEQDAAFKP